MPVDVAKAANVVAEVLRANAEEAERIGTLPPASVAAVEDAGLFHMMLPPDLGGPGIDLVTCIETVETLSRADGSGGWTVMANSLATSLIAAFCGDEAIEVIFGGADSRRPVVAGMVGPGGNCVEVEGGYRGSGSYHFGSGVNHVGWLAAGMFVLDDGKPRMLANGTPQVQVVVVPNDGQASKLTGNWDVIGLSGTGSYDYELPEQFYAAPFTFERTGLHPQRGGPTFELGVAGLGCLGHAAVALGITARAFEEIATIAPDKMRPTYPAAVGEYPLFLHEFAEHEAAYQSVRAYIIDVFGRAEDRLIAGHELSDEDQQRFRQCATYSHTVAAAAVRFCYTWAGTDALRHPHALGRCLRDIEGATQHFFVDPISMVGAGRELVGAWRRHEAG
jgi:alkylation response protein AidB-like acyl-CoA dehydrogenase